jgi:uncharacterized membrane protein
MKAYLTVGVTMLVGAALFEAALIPGLMIGGAALVAPAVLPRLGRRPRRAPRRTVRRSEPGSAGRYALSAPIRAAHKLRLTQSALKTISFRVVATGVDFAANYIVLGDPMTAAGLSGIGLVLGPGFYFVHETLWNYFGPDNGAVAVRLPFQRREAQYVSSDEPKPDESRYMQVSRAIAKTATFRLVATIPDFTVTFLVVGDAATATAAALAGLGFVLGPFVYLGHEMVWDAFTARNRPPFAMIAPGALPPRTAGGCQGVEILTASQPRLSYGRTERQIDLATFRRKIEGRNRAGFATCRD